MLFIVALLVLTLKNSKVTVLSPDSVDYDVVSPLTLNITNIDFLKSMKYHGTHISSGPSFSFSAAPDLRSFCRSANSVLNVVNKPEEVVLTHLLHTNCVLILSYASAVNEYFSREMNDCNTTINDAVKRIFS